MSKPRESLVTNDEMVSLLPIDKLEVYPYSPFKLYDGERKQNLVTSIKESGIINPITVIPAEKRGYYLILAGNNRVDACKQLGLTEIKAIVKFDLSEEEAIKIVIESNFFQRSIDEMLPSELAKALELHYQTIKQQGKRNDLMYAEEDLTSGRVCQKLEDSTSGRLCQKLEDEYKLSARSIRNYIRLNKLLPELLNMVDSKVIALYTAVELSHLKAQEQIEIADIIKSQKYEITLTLAEELKKRSKETGDTINIAEAIESIIQPTKNTSNDGEKPNIPEKVKMVTFKISVKEILNYVPNEDLSKLQTIMIEALKLYYDQKQNVAS